MMHPSDQALKGSEKYIMNEGIKAPLDKSTRRHRIGHYLRECLPRQGRIVYGQLLRGAAYGVGSGSVSLLIVWWQSRH